MTAPASDPLEVALEISHTAGQLLKEGLGRRHSMGVNVKRTDTDLVTEFDKRSEALIVERLRHAFPSDEILAEEGGLQGKPASRRWLVDPLDGTTNFAHGFPFFAVSIGLEIGGQFEIGVVEAPALGLTFAARRGGGATLNGTPIHVSDEPQLGRSLLGTGFPYDRQTSPDNNFAQFIAFQRRAQGVRRAGAAALDLAFVARGSFEGFWEMKLKPWDVAAGALLVTEAGGMITDWLGEPLSSEKGACVASNGRIHQAMLDVLRETGVPPSAR